MEIQRGDKIIGVFGATIAEWAGEITKVEDTNQGVMVDVMWDNGSVTYVTGGDIRQDYFNPTGSPIGYYANPF